MEFKFMDNVTSINKYKKIPVFIFLETEVLSRQETIKFITLDINSLFECIRHYMRYLVTSSKENKAISFSFETRLLTPDSINKITEDISEANKLLALDSQAKIGNSTKKCHLCLLSKEKDND